MQPSMTYACHAGVQIGGARHQDPQVAVVSTGFGCGCALAQALRRTCGVLA